MSTLQNDPGKSQVPRLLLYIAVGFLLLFLLRWGYTEYWISQHCTEVLGTRVCQ